MAPISLCFGRFGTRIQSAKLKLSSLKDLCEKQRISRSRYLLTVGGGIHLKFGSRIFVQLTG